MSAEAELRTLTTTEELRREAHVIERVNGLIVVGLDLSCNKGKQKIVSETVRKSRAFPIVISSADIKS
jgi:hypothetical protein